MEPSPAPRELILVAKPSAGLRASGNELFSIFDVPLDSLRMLLFYADASLQPLFGLSEELIDNRVSMLPEPEDEVTTSRSLFYKVSARDDSLETLETLATNLLNESSVQTAYIKPGVELPLIAGNQVSAPLLDSSLVTKDFHPRQLYLRAEENNLNAIGAWNLPGGGGDGIQIIDIEGAWRFTHED